MCRNTIITTFAGWWNGEEGSEFIPANALTKVSDGVTFTAVWNPIVPEQVTVTADLAGGKIGDFEGHCQSANTMLAPSYAP